MKTRYEIHDLLMQVIYQNIGDTPHAQRYMLENIVYSIAGIITGLHNDNEPWRQIEHSARAMVIERDADGKIVPLRSEWNDAIDAALETIPGGQVCDPQAIADGIRALKREVRS